MDPRVSANSSIGQLGRSAIETSNYLVDLISFCYSSLYSWTSKKHYLNAASYQGLLTQIFFTGIDAFTLVFVLAFVSGASLTMQLLSLTGEVSNQLSVLQPLAYFMIMEVGPMMTALILIVRSGSAIAVDIGNMKLQGELEGLFILGIDLRDYLIAPRLIACAISQLTLAIYFSVVSLYGGIALSSLVNSQSYFGVLTTAISSIAPFSLLIFVLKNLLFGLAIAGAACLHALQVKDCSTELPKQTQKAIVRALLLVFVIDLFFGVVG